MYFIAQQLNRRTLLFISFQWYVHVLIESNYLVLAIPQMKNKQNYFCFIGCYSFIHLR